jgi:hypothetical protein
MTRHYGSILSVLIPCSFFFLVTTQLIGLPPWGSILFGICPLIWYHLGYLVPRARKGLTQAAIDSVYYFGFVLTLSALALSAGKQSSPSQQRDRFA